MSPIPWAPITMGVSLTERIVALVRAIFRRNPPAAPPNARTGAQSDAAPVRRRHIPGALALCLLMLAGCSSLMPVFKADSLPALLDICEKYAPCDPCGPVVPAPVPPAPVPPPVIVPPEDDAGAVDAIDLKQVTWVHAKGQDIANWPVTATLGAVEFRLPMVCSSGMDWPASWSTYGEKAVSANHVVLAQIDGRWYGGAWEAMYRNVAACRPLEVLRDGTPDLGPFGQVEQDPFWQWYPAKGETVCFMVTSWIRSGVLQPVGRSNAVCTVWPL